MTIKIIDVKIVGFCSNCRAKDKNLEIPYKKDGSVYENNIIACINCEVFGDEK